MALLVSWVGLRWVGCRFRWIARRGSGRPAVAVGCRRGAPGSALSGGSAHAQPVVVGPEAQLAGEARGRLDLVEELQQRGLLLGRLVGRLLPPVVEVDVA